MGPLGGGFLPQWPYKNKRVFSETTQQIDRYSPAETGGAGQVKKPRPAKPTDQPDAAKPPAASGQVGVTTCLPRFMKEERINWYSLE